MTWSLVDRADHDTCLRRATQSPGPVIITGERGMGRTTLLARVLKSVAAGPDRVVRLRPAGQDRFAALRASFPCPLPRPALLPDAVCAMTGYADGRRLVVAADDAHLVDDASLLALRELSRRGQAVLLVTRPLTAGPPVRPDASECLSYEPGVTVVLLQPFSVNEVAMALAAQADGPVAQATVEAVHAATGGIPRLLHALAIQARLAERLTRPGQRWSPAAPQRPTAQDGGGYPGARRLIEATQSAWQDLAAPRAYELCRLALACGIREEIAPIWASLLLFGSGAAAADDFLESLPGETIVTTPELALVRALTLAFGLRRAEEASRFLGVAAERGRSPQLMRASRAWLLAVTGRLGAAAQLLRVMDRGDLATAMFVHAARAALARLDGRQAETVFHLRRALASAESGSDGFPWMRPYLKASLIDALLLTGRVTDAASLARRFHAREPHAGWDLAVALNFLLGTRNQEPDLSIPA